MVDINRLRLWLLNVVLYRLLDVGILVLNVLRILRYLSLRNKCMDRQWLVGIVGRWWRAGVETVDWVVAWHCEDIALLLFEFGE